MVENKTDVIEHSSKQSIKNEYNILKSNLLKEEHNILEIWLPDK